MDSTGKLPPKQDAPKPVAAWRREALLCLSFANLCLFRVWESNLTYSRTDTFFMTDVPSRADYLAAIAVVFMVAAALFAVVRLCCKYLGPRAFRVVQYLSLGLIVLPLNGVRASLRTKVWFFQSPVLHSIGKWGAIFVVLPAALAILWAAWRWQKPIFRVATGALMVLSPLCIFTFGQAVVDAALYQGRRLRDLPAAPALAVSGAGPRVVWIVFDEWDYRLTFVDRPAGVSMPATDRLRSECLSASDARPPGSDTIISMPAYVTGRVLETTYRGLEFESRQTEFLRQIRWQQTPNIFAAARSAGFNVALAGYYFPYCRMFNNSLTECAWWPLSLQVNSTGDTLAQKIRGQMESLFETSSFSPFGQSLSTRHQARSCQEFLEKAKAEASNPAMGFVFLHAPIPHAPHAYNRQTGKFDRENNPLGGYVDSLALMDRALSEIRQEMERSGQWERTALIASSDHPYRASEVIDGKSDPRIPFLLKLPGETKAVAYTGQFNTIVTADLVLSILRGQVSSVEDALAWLEQHRQYSEDPVPAGN